MMSIQITVLEEIFVFIYSYKKPLFKEMKLHSKLLDQIEGYVLTVIITNKFTKVIKCNLVSK